MISSLFFLTLTGEVVIEKQFREKIPRSSLEDFWATFVDPLRQVQDASNVIQYSRFAFVHIIRGNIVLLGITTKETPPMLVIEILSMLASTIGMYIKELNEDSLRENFSVVYQLLEELMDNGYPLTTEMNVLEELVPAPTLANKVRSILDAPKKGARGSDYNAVPWRNPGVKYTSNEIFFDVIEYMDIIMDAEGGLVRAAIRGVIEAKCELSGMPEIILSLTNSDSFEDVCYHRCVRHNRYESDRTISFVPPDGRFSLFQYRCKPLQSLQPPFYVTPQVTFSKSGGRLNCMVGLRHGGMSLSDKERSIHRLTINIPLPPQTDAININGVSHGTHSFNTATKILTWKIGQLTGNTTSLSGEFFFTQSSAESVTEGTGEAVTVEFQIPDFTWTGVKVDSVSILNESYKSYKGVKYVTRAGRFIIRTV